MYTTRTLALALAAPALAVALTACSGSGTVTASGTAGPAGVAATTPAATSSAGTSSSGDPAPTTAGSTPTKAGSSSHSSGTTQGDDGCSGGGSVPAGAGRATTADLDGDGRKDTLWLADRGGRRELGVRTASGAVLSKTFSSAAPQAATAVAGLVDGDVPVILLNTGRSVQLYTVHDCAIAVTTNPQGRQYTFDLGFTGYGTGVGCPLIGSTRELVGYDAKAGSDQVYDVTRTVIRLSSGGRRATNGTTTTIVKGASASDHNVKLAENVTCGTGGRADEPQS